MKSSRTTTPWLCGIFSLLWLPALAEPQLQSGALDVSLSTEFSEDVRPLLKRLCFECHQGESAESSVDLSVFKTLDSVRSNPSQWEQVRGVVRIGAMPPQDADAQPTDAERTKISEWTEQALHAFDCNEPNPPAPITVRRLNNIEYDNTIRDLFQIDIAPSKAIGFVSDDVGNGFDNQGEVLSISPLSFEKYVKAAEWVSNQAIVLDRNRLREQVIEAESLQVEKSFTARFLFADGDYEIITRLRFGRKQKTPVPAAIYIDEERIDEVMVPVDGRTFQWKRVMTAGEHTIRIEFIDDPALDLHENSSKLLYIDRVAAIGPKRGEPPMPIHHKRLMIAEPDDRHSATEASKAIIENFLPRAFRRPTTAIETQRIVEVFEQAFSSGATFGESMQFALQSILVSPEFLFRLEPSGDVAKQPLKDKSSQDGPTPLREIPINDFELANRMSYFLWSSMPDDRLLELATAGKLTQPTILNEEIHRLLESSKSDALVAGFFDQWLGLRNLQTVSVDENSFEYWSDKLSEAIAKETFLFCKEMLHNGSLMDVLQADFTFVNPRLADFYDLAFEDQDPTEMYSGYNRGTEFDRRLGSYRDEDRWIRVDLPKYRRGLLTHASILTLTSNPTRTSPVKRGKWVLENILGDPPPPAPPGVPPLEENSGDNQNRTLRQTLEIHRANPACASCHRVLDPIGLGFENFDAIGRWRTTDDGIKIDADGEFADGRTFSGPRELLVHLQVEQPKIARHFAAQLLTYALGRGLTRGDSCTLDSIVAQAKDADYRVSEFVRAIINSKPFLYVGLPE